MENRRHTTGLTTREIAHCDLLARKMARRAEDVAIRPPASAAEWRRRCTWAARQDARHEEWVATQRRLMIGA